METRLKALMQEKGVMSKTLAEQMGITEVSMSALVNGRTNNLETLAKAAQCLGVPLWQLFADPSEVIAQPLSPSSTSEDVAVMHCPHCGKMLQIHIK